MKKFVLALALLPAFVLGACGDKGLPEGELKVTATYRKEHVAERAMDNDITTGWVGKKKANDRNGPQVVNIDLGKETTFSSIKIDDTFAAGVTNKAPDYLKTSVTYNRGDCTSLKAGTSVANVVNGAADGQSWKSSAIPTTENSQDIYLSLQEPVEVLKLELNNEMNNTVSKNFAVYYSAEALGRNQYDVFDNYTLLFEKTDNTEMNVEYIPSQGVTIGSLWIKYYEQTNEQGACEASLDEIVFYGSAEGYTEDHFPTHFILMVSNNGKTYDTFYEERANVSGVWEKTIAEMTDGEKESVKYRFIKYLVYEESNNNYPSIGEISFLP